MLHSLNAACLSNLQPQQQRNQQNNEAVHGTEVGFIAMNDTQLCIDSFWWNHRLYAAPLVGWLSFRMNEETSSFSVATASHATATNFLLQEVERQQKLFGEHIFQRRAGDASSATRLLCAFQWAPPSVVPSNSALIASCQFRRQTERVEPECGVMMSNPVLWLQRWEQSLQSVINQLVDSQLNQSRGYIFMLNLFHRRVTLTEVIWGTERIEHGCCNAHIYDVFIVVENDMLKLSCNVQTCCMGLRVIEITACMTELLHVQYNWQMLFIFEQTTTQLMLVQVFVKYSCFMPAINCYCKRRGFRTRDATEPGTHTTRVLIE